MNQILDGLRLIDEGDLRHHDELVAVGKELDIISPSDDFRQYQAELADFERALVEGRACGSLSGSRPSCDAPVGAAKACRSRHFTSSSSNRNPCGAPHSRRGLPLIHFYSMGGSLSQKWSRSFANVGTKSKSTAFHRSLRM